MSAKAPKYEHKDVTFIERKVSYRDNNKRVLDESIIISGKAPEGWVRFSVRAMVKAEFEGGKATKKFDIPLPTATTVEEAYAEIEKEYDAAMAKASKELRDGLKQAVVDQLREDKIQTAPGSMLGEGGKLRGGPGGIVQARG
jgi:hypothetical protein